MKFNTFHVFYRYKKPEILEWAEKIKQELADFIEDSEQPDLVIILGGDGGILEAARKYPKAMLIGFNLGTKGFLAIAEGEQEFKTAVEAIKNHNFTVSQRGMVAVKVERGNETVFEASGLNEVVVSSLVGIVELTVAIDEQPYQTVRGTGLLVSTATGSTAYNLSAHGPIVVPELPALIVTELLDHDIPTPSLVIASHQSVTAKIEYFRETNRLKLADSDENADVVLDVDGANLFGLKQDDIIRVAQGKDTIKFVQLKPYDFLSNVRRSFTLR